MRQLEDTPAAQLSLMDTSEAVSVSADGTPGRVAVRPIIKWAGGKAQLLPALQHFLPPRERILRYFEPFVGGAAMFFYLQHARSHLSDTNAELINLYTVVRDDLDTLVAALQCHAAVHSEAHFYRVRAQAPSTLNPAERAARVVYLNKTCYNGLYRVNGKGQFNVPFGHYKKPRILDEPNLRSANSVLRNADLRVGDYETTLCDTGSGDFIYFDPPYHPVSTTASFTSYTDKSFGANEQARLALAFRHLHTADCYLMQSNSDTPLIRALYFGFRIEQVKANRAINSKGDKRGPVSELVIMNYSKTGELLGG